MGRQCREIAYNIPAMEEDAGSEARRAAFSAGMAEVLLDRVCQGVLTVSAAGRVAYANRTIAAMIGVPRSSILGTPFCDLAAGPERARLRAALGTGRDIPTQQRLVLPRSDNSELPVLMYFAPLAPGQTSCLVTDLSDQKRREESAERSSRFLGTLAHELRNGLQPMQNALRALAQAQNLDEDTRRAIAAMLAQTGRLLALVDDLRKING